MLKRVENNEVLLVKNSIYVDSVKNNNEYSYLLLLSRKSDMDIFGIVPPPAMDCLFKSLIKDGDRPELVAVGIRFVPYTVSDVLIKLKLISD